MSECTLANFPKKILWYGLTSMVTSNLEWSRRTDKRYLVSVWNARNKEHKFVMATSSSDESSTAPKDFHLSSSLDSGSRLSPNRRKCPLCSSFRKTFYCKECINSGNFYSPNSHIERCVLYELDFAPMVTSDLNS